MVKPAASETQESVAPAYPRVDPFATSGGGCGGKFGRVPSVLIAVIIDISIIGMRAERKLQKSCREQGHCVIHTASSRIRALSVRSLLGPATCVFIQRALALFPQTFRQRIVSFIGTR
jgi:hypothetical protein